MSNNDDLTSEAIRHLASLTRISMSDEEVEKMRDEMSNILDNIAVLNEINTDSSVVTSSRHYDLLCKSSIEIENVLKGIDNKISGDLLAIDIRQALQHLGELTGEITNDEVLGNIFSKFCIGK